MKGAKTVKVEPTDKPRRCVVRISTAYSKRAHGEAGVRCSCRAKYVVNGRYMCGHHASQAALNYLLKNSK